LSVTQIIATINVTLTREEFKTKVAELVTPAEGHGSVAPIGPLFNREALEGIWDIRISRLKNANDTLERMWKLFSEQRKDFYTLLDVIFQDPSWKMTQLAVIKSRSMIFGKQPRDELLGMKSECCRMANSSRYQL